jgi:hypothetical protein
MKVTLKQVAFNKDGKCRGKVKISGKSKRRICYLPLKKK